MFFVAHVEVSINVGGGRNGRVPEEFGHLNQFGSIAEKDACEGMAKIVEPNVAQSVLFKQESVVLCHIIRSKELTELVGADEVIVLSVVAAFEHLFVQFLAFLYFKESLEQFRKALLVYRYLLNRFEGTDSSFGITYLRVF